MKRKETKSLDDVQTVRLLKALEDEPVKFRLAVEVLLFLGARRGEVVGLKWEDVDFEHCTVNIDKAILYLPDKGIYEDTPKNETSNRVIKLPQSVMQKLQAYRKLQLQAQFAMGHLWEGEGHIFTQVNGKPMHPDTPSKWFGKFLKKHNAAINDRADLTAKEKRDMVFPNVSIHSLRHTNASLLIAKGLNLRTIANRLGHASTDTTTKIYAHAIRTADAIASDALEDILLHAKAQ